jgi:hypothetical protein
LPKRPAPRRSALPWRSSGRWRQDRLDLLDLPLRWLVRAGELVDRYRHLPFGLVDATVVAASEMLEEPKLATLDHRHFGVVQPRHVSALTLLPE